MGSGCMGSGGITGMGGYGGMGRTDWTEREEPTTRPEPAVQPTPKPTWDSRAEGFKDAAGRKLPWAMIREAPRHPDAMSTAAVYDRRTDLVFTAQFGGIAGFQGRIAASYERADRLPRGLPKLEYDPQKKAYKTTQGKLLPTFTVEKPARGTMDGQTVRIAYDASKDRFYRVTEGGIAGLRSKVTGIYTKA